MIFERARIYVSTIWKFIGTRKGRPRVSSGGIANGNQLIDESLEFLQTSAASYTTGNSIKLTFNYETESSKTNLPSRHVSRLTADHLPALMRTHWTEFTLGDTGCSYFFPTKQCPHILRIKMRKKCRC